MVGAYKEKEQVMANTFEILAGFLDHFDHEVEGREQLQVSDGVRLKLREFAAGKLPSHEQDDLVQQLNRNPEWVASLAAEVKALRAGKAAT